MKKLFFLLLILAGCASDPIVVPIVEPKFILPIVVEPILPSPVRLTPPKFYIITEANIDSIFEESSQQAFYAVSATGYQELAGNIQELRRYILELQNLIVFYKKSLDFLQEAAEEHNGKIRDTR